MKTITLSISCSLIIWNNNVFKCTHKLLMQKKIIVHLKDAMETICDLPNDVKGRIHFHSNHYNTGEGDGCTGRVVPGKHTRDYLRGYADGQVSCHSR